MITRLINVVVVVVSLYLVDQAIFSQDFGRPGVIYNEIITTDNSEFSRGVTHELLRLKTKRNGSIGAALNLIKIGDELLLVVRLRNLSNKYIVDLNLSFTNRNIKLYDFLHYRKEAIRYRSLGELPEQKRALQKLISKMHNMTIYNPARSSIYSWFYVSEENMRKINGGNNLKSFAINIEGMSRAHYELQEKERKIVAEFLSK